MSKTDLIELASQFLYQNDIEFVTPGRLGRDIGDRVEVIFPVPEALDPDVAVVDPADVRVWVWTEDNKIELIHQM